MKRINYRLVWFWFILLAGFLAGVCLPEMLKMNSGTYTSFFSMYSFKKFQQQEIQMKEVFLYILSIRMEMLLFLWLSSFTKMGIWLHAGVGAWMLCTAGMLLRMFVLKKGMQGVWVFLCCLLPQWLLYGIMWKREITFCLRKQKEMESYRGRNTVHFLNLLALCAGGCVCETWLGTQFQKKFFSFFL